MSSNDPSKVHADIVLSVKGGVFGPQGMMDIIAHGDVDGAEVSSKRMRQIASLVFEAAWSLEDAANKFEDEERLRVFEDSSDNHWFEVKEDVFYCASDREEAQSLYAAGNQHASEKSLRATNKDLKEVK